MALIPTVLTYHRSSGWDGLDNALLVGGYAEGVGHLVLNRHLEYNKPRYRSDQEFTLCGVP